MHSACGDLPSPIFLEINTTMAKILQLYLQGDEGQEICSLQQEPQQSDLPVFFFKNWCLNEPCGCKKQGAGRAGAFQNRLVLKYTFHYPDKSEQFAYFT